MIALLDKHLRSRLFFNYHLPSSGCDCNWWYSRDFGEKGTITIGHTKCLNDKRAHSCPQKVEHWKSGTLLRSIDVPRKARLLNEFLEEHELI